MINQENDGQCDKIHLKKRKTLFMLYARDKVPSDILVQVFFSSHNQMFNCKIKHNLNHNSYIEERA